MVVSLADRDRSLAHRGRDPLGRAAAHVVDRQDAWRHDPVETVGQVRIFAPTAKCRSYRLRWVEPDGTPGDTTAGSDPAAAIAKATALDRRLVRAAGAAALTPLGEIFTVYLADGRSLRGHETVPALDLDRALCDRMRAQAGTPNMVRVNTTALRAFLLWGYRHSPSHFTAEQVEYLSPGVVVPRPVLAGTPAPGRRTRIRRVGQSGDYIEDEDAPSATQVRALGEVLGNLVGPWGRLAPEVAASCGPRWRRAVPAHRRRRPPRRLHVRRRAASAHRLADRLRRSRRRSGRPPVPAQGR
jgi:hypothetical protein